jgi:hypothetical protein
VVGGGIFVPKKRKKIGGWKEQYIEKIKNFN